MFQNLIDEFGEKNYVLPGWGVSMPMLIIGVAGGPSEGDCEKN